jgi:hypothetical protein
MANDDYLFFKNNETAFTGPSSSGALIYSQVDNLPLASVVCSSVIQNNEKVKVIRNLKISSLAFSKAVELTPEKIQKFQSLDCKIYNGRFAGGD